ncbi:DNA adenine methylase [Arthrobacter sp. B3I4]|uniref:DNA adenine methylase n=1 Tax=Arthrobacter sp. B3I4 TaxID=3042267 RepID=UPI0027804B7A|nr:DNA adenine methylase [Arthrobacter sp. B3I4]MDQ0755055.1 DNA adenine methylase [Arthrobacter sp. B3I4]
MTGAAAARFPSPLRYPGGKGKIANYIKLIMLKNDLLGSDYVEPYAGGASVALSLLFEDYAGHIHINDLNEGVHAFWHSVLNDTDALCSLIETTEVSVEEWHFQKDVQRSISPSTLELGFSTFFLNRTNRSGIISGGIIGGLKQDGPWKIDARFNKDNLVQRIRKISRFKSRISLTKIDAVEFVMSWAEPEQPPAFLYLDPPYYVKGEGLYDNFYEHQDHAEVAASVSRLAHPWIVSYDAAPAILRLYEAQDSLHYGLSYSAAKSSKGSEVIFHAPELVLPDELSPSGISAASFRKKRMELLS